MDSFLNTVGDKIQDAGVALSDIALDGSKIAKEEKNIKEQLRLIGELFVEQHQLDCPEEYQAMVNSVLESRESIRKIHERQEQDKQERKDHRAKRDADKAAEKALENGQKICPECGALVKVSAKFCTKCGAKFPVVETIEAIKAIEVKETVENTEVGVGKAGGEENQVDNENS